MQQHLHERIARMEAMFHERSARMEAALDERDARMEAALQERDAKMQQLAADAKQRGIAIQQALQQRDETIDTLRQELRECKATLAHTRAHMGEEMRLREWTRTRGILSLPNETLEHIFMHVGVQDIADVASTSKRFS